MNKIFLSALFTGTILFMSCGQTGDPVAKQKAELQKLKDQQAALVSKIQKAEEALAKVDSSSAQKRKNKTDRISTGGSGRLSPILSNCRERLMRSILHS